MSGTDVPPTKENPQTTDAKHVEDTCQITAPTIDTLVAIMRRLRDPDGGCPWDLEQNFRTIAPYTIEEAYEVADAIDSEDLPALREELGDLLLQVVFHSQMAAEVHAFSFDDVVKEICGKMIARHPHVFGDVDVADAETQTRAWEAMKAEERRRKSGDKAPSGALDGVARGLPALLRAEKLQKRAARVGFDWPEIDGVLGKIGEEIAELQELFGSGDQDRIEDEVGDVLFAVANLARWLKIDPESALRRTNAKFERRFRHIERRLAETGRTPTDATLEEMEEIWQEAKTAAAPQE